MAALVLSRSPVKFEWNWRLLLSMFMMTSSVSGYKFKSGINTGMLLRSVCSAQVSSTTCQECETCFTEEPQTMNDETCNKIQKLSQTPTRVFAERLSSIQQNNLSHNPTHALSTKIQHRNIIIDHPAVSCFSQCRVSEQEPGAQSQDTHCQSSGPQPS